MNIRSKTQEVLEKGKEERGNFQPTGAPLRAYQYWEKNSKHAPSRQGKGENFCHFWRVVAIWAPLMVMRKAIVATAETTVFQIFVAIAAVALMIGVLGTGVGWGTFAIGLGIAAYVVTGIISSIVLSVEDDQTSATEIKWAKVGAVISFAVAGPILGVVWAIKNWNDDWNDLAGKIVFGLGIFVAAAALVLGIGSLVAEEGLIALVYLAGGILGFALLGALILGFVILVGELISGLRKVARDKRIERRRARINEEPTGVRAEPREPSALSKMLTNIADFIVFFGQIVRVKKWKICPIVTIPKD